MGLSLAAAGTPSAPPWTGSLHLRSGPPRRITGRVLAVFVALLVSSLSGAQGLQKSYERFANKSTSSEINVCILTADFWGQGIAAGGTATAFHLLAEALSDQPFVGAVRFVGLHKDRDVCKLLGSPSAAKVQYMCLEPHHFEPEIVDTFPYDSLGHAALAWLVEHEQGCDVVHSHEWGGVMAPIATWITAHQARPSLRLVVQAHGGHQWSAQGQWRRSLDLMSLRIDHHERMAVQLADTLLSPTQYMLAVLRARGWSLPMDSGMVANVLPTGQALQEQRQAKPVWRVAFFGRLEERKGIRLFAEAVSKLDFSRHPRLEVLIVGKHAGNSGSQEWLARKVQDWPCKVHMLTTVDREEALQAIQQEGVLLVMPSLVENMPFALAEASILGIPVVVLDAGGVTEMLDPELHADSIVRKPFAPNLAAKLAEVLQQGSWQTPVLSPTIVSGRQVWADWHRQYRKGRTHRMAQDQLARKKLTAGTSPWLHVIRLQATGHQSALEVKRAVCQGFKPKDAMPGYVLLLPANFEMLDSAGTPERLASVAQTALAGSRGSRLGALTFGVRLPNGLHAFPAGPSWALYAATVANCSYDVPLLLAADTFCEAFLAEAGDFREYHSWVLSIMLRQAGLMVHTFPEVLFSLTAYTSTGPGCVLYNPPAWDITSQTAANLYTDAQDLLVNIHVAPWPKPLTSMREDASTAQGHRGWQYLAADGQWLKQEPLVWLPHGSQHNKDPRWGCSSHPYPHFSRNALHPCVSSTSQCCGNLPVAQAVLAWTSFVEAASSLVSVIFESQPKCGDGLDVTVTFTTAAGSSVLQSWAVQASAPDRAARYTAQFELGFVPGDTLKLAVHPRQNQDCDSVSNVEIVVRTREHKLPGVTSG